MKYFRSIKSILFINLSEKCRFIIKQKITNQIRKKNYFTCKIIISKSELSIFIAIININIAHLDILEKYNSSTYR